MKKASILITLLVILLSCEKQANDIKKLQFLPLREQITNLLVTDDSVTQTTTVTNDGAVIMQENWEHGIYSGPSMPTRLLSAKTATGTEFILQGNNDLFYHRLIVIQPGLVVSYFDIPCIKLIAAELREDKFIWLKYNNSWTRTGPLPDQQITFRLN